MRRREIPAPVRPNRSATITHNGRIIEEGDELSIRGEGRFTFHYGWNGNELTCWGPIGPKASPSWRTFRTNRISRIHNKTIRGAKP